MSLLQRDVATSPIAIRAASFPPPTKLKPPKPDFAYFPADIFFVFLLAIFGAVMLRICNILFDKFFALTRSQVDDWLALIGLLVGLSLFLFWNGRIQPHHHR